VAIEPAGPDEPQNSFNSVIDVKSRAANSLKGVMPEESQHLPQLVFTVEETAAILKVTQKTVYRLVDRKMLHAVKALRHLRISKKSLDALLASNSGEVGHE
jgi:excisionase family DNA binding protein